MWERDGVRPGSRASEAHPPAAFAAVTAVVLTGAPRCGSMTQTLHNDVVMNELDQLSAVFGALADPTRRAILANLTSGDLTVGQLSAPFAVSQPAISRHLKVLEQAGLISRSDATAWLVGYREYWEESYERLDALLASIQQHDPAG